MPVAALAGHANQKCSQTLLSGGADQLPFENHWFNLSLTHSSVKSTRMLKDLCVPNAVLGDTGKSDRSGSCPHGADILIREKTVNTYKIYLDKVKSESGNHEGM